MSSNEMSRRDFIKVTTIVTGGIMGLTIGIPSVIYLVNPALQEDKAGKPVVIGNIADIPVGTPYPFSFTVTKVNGWERTANSYGGFVVRRSEAPNDMIVLSSRCTHLSCRVNWNDVSHEFRCPCHDAAFDIDGVVLDGPPPEPLNRFEYEVADDGSITIYPVEVKAG